MEINKQNQEAGDFSQQIQGHNIIVNNGITEERARAIFSEMLPNAIKEYTKEAGIKAYERNEVFKDLFIAKFAEDKYALQQFADPIFQFNLRRALQEAAKTDSVNDYNLLSELLLYHVKKGKSRKNNTSIRKAIEIVTEIDADVLCALTVAYAIVYYKPFFGDIINRIKILNNLFEKLMYEELPSGDSWLDHLDILGVVRLSPFSGVAKFKDYYPSKLNLCVGISKTSNDYEKSIDLLKSVNIDKSVLSDNKLLEGYVCLKVESKESICNLMITKEGKSRKINDNEIKVVSNIFDLYVNDAPLQEEVNSKFIEIWDTFEILRKVRIWWESIPQSFSITQVGDVLSYTNAKRCEPRVPDLIL